jgi:GT2 family glycosyltransferase
MTEEKPLISIIVRTKDRAKLLKRALQSISAQTYRPIEVVLVNDGGCNLNTEELKMLLGEVSLNYIRLEKNVGRAYAGNVGIENANGKYVGFLDDDDEFYPDHIQTLVAVLMREPYPIAYADAETILMDLDKEGNFIEKGRHMSYRHEFIPEVLLIQNYIPFMCLLFDKKVFDGIKIDEGLDLFEDWNLLIDLSQKFSFAHIKKVTAKYIQWSVESQINRRALGEDFSKEAYRKILQRNADKIIPETIYKYCVAMNTEKAELIAAINTQKAEFVAAMNTQKAELIATMDRDSSARARAMAVEKERIEAEREKIESEKNVLVAEKNALAEINQRIEAENQRIEAENQRIEAENQRIEAEKEILYREFVGLQNWLAEITNSLSWKMVVRYRKIKEKLLPMGSRRRVLYDLFLKSVRVINREGLSGFVVRVKRRMRFASGYMKLRSSLKKNRTLTLSSEMRTSVDFGFRRKPVFIVMPVYNGYECIDNCINSIFKHTDLSFHTLVIVDDKSTDRKVTEYLSKLAESKNGRKIDIVSNADNLGFVKTINRGMQVAPCDVIILNSDTVVTKNWVEKLQRAAYSKLRVATATPLSNYVTINGLPEPFKYNPVPLGMDIDSFGAFLEEISLRYYPEVPAGVGFCMYIKRSVLEEMGYFDDARFEKGYAEETDFCMRALKKGYIHVIDDATYIYHVGGVSFESVKDPDVLREKNLMIERNLETLKSLHPEYLGLVEKALAENLAPVHTYIRLRLEMEEKRAKNTVCNRSEA